jgi:hypothetical protein
MLLEFVGVGPQRTGTTWLYECLREHPQLCFPQGVKETSFFDERFNTGWSWYESHFLHRRDGQLCSEIAATYFDIPEAAERICDHNPKCRVIITLRDPVARSFSLYLHHRKKGRLTCDFREAVKKMPRIIDSSHYRIHVDRWRKIFGSDQVLVILLDDIASSPDSVLKRTFEFIGVEEVPLSTKAREAVNVASLPASQALASAATRGADWLRNRGWYGPIELAKKFGLKRIYGGLEDPLPAVEPEVRGHLINEFGQDIAFVEELIHRSLPEWRCYTLPTEHRDP